MLCRSVLKNLLYTVFKIIPVKFMGKIIIFFFGFYPTGASNFFTFYNMFIGPCIIFRAE